MVDINPLRLVFKGLIMFLALNLGFAALDPQIGSWSIYNGLVPGRPRLPIEGTWNAHGFVVARQQEIGALFSAHTITSKESPTPRLQVILLGDSQTFGAWVPVGQTLGARLAAGDLRACGRAVEIENLSHLGPSALRDFLILNRALEYAPRAAVIWMLEPAAFLPLSASLVFKDSSGASQVALDAFGLSKHVDAASAGTSLLARTIWSRRVELHTWFNLQMLGLYWAASGDDEWTRYNELADLRSFLIPLQNNVSASRSWQEYESADWPKLAEWYGVLDAAHRMLGERPLLLVAQPTFIASGHNSDIRYNSLYPRWAYDGFLAELQAAAGRYGWAYLDLHTALPESEFVDVEHLNSGGEVELARLLAPAIMQLICS